jgi:hypothetical protein
MQGPRLLRPAGAASLRVVPEAARLRRRQGDRAMMDSFDRHCGFTRPERPRLPAAILACAALVALIALGSPANGAPAPGEPAVSAP